VLLLAATLATLPLGEVHAQQPLALTGRITNENGNPVPNATVAVPALEIGTTVRSDGMPTLDLSGTLSRNGYPHQGLQSVRATQTSIGLTLTIPFFDGFSRTYRIRGAQAQAEPAARVTAPQPWTDRSCPAERRRWSIFGRDRPRG